MSWLWIKFLAPKPLKFPKTSIKTFLCPHHNTHFSQGNANCIYLLFSLQPSDTQRGLISVSFRSASAKYFFKHSKLSERHLICIASVDIQVVYVLRWVSSCTLSLELLEMRPELHCIFGGAEYDITTLIHGATSEQPMPLVYSPSSMKAQLCSSVSKIGLDIRKVGQTLEHVS